MEDVRLRKVPSKCTPLNGLLPQEPGPRQVEIDVVLLRSPFLRPEDEQSRVDALAPQRIDVCPTGAGEVYWKMKNTGVDGRNDTIRGLVRWVETTPVPRRS